MRKAMPTGSNIKPTMPMGLELFLKMLRYISPPMKPIPSSVAIMPTCNFDSMSIAIIITIISFYIRINRIFFINVYFNTSIPANTRLEIKDSTGNTIIDHISAKAFTNAVIGSTDFSLGSTYSIYLDSEKYQDFTISNIVTVVGNSRANTNVGPPRDHK